MKFTVFALTIFFTCAAFAQDAGKSKPADKPEADEVKTATVNTAAETYEMSIGKEEAERDRVARATGRMPAEPAIKLQPAQNTPPQSPTKVVKEVLKETPKEAPKEQIKQKK